MINWDLSKSHTKADVGWKGDDNANQVSPVRSVRIALPRGMVFEAKADVREVILDAEGDTLKEVTVTFNEQTAEDVVARARELSNRFEFTDNGTFDKFLRDVRQLRSERRDESADGGRGGSSGFPPGTKLKLDEPSIGVSILDSFDDKKPWLIDFGMSWYKGDSYAWDLSRSHTVPDVGSFPKDWNQYSVPMTSLHLTLPEGRQFQVDGRDGEARLERKDQTITSVHTLFGEPSPEEAHKRAWSLANEWGVPTNNLDAWLADVNARRQKGEDGSKATPVVDSGPAYTPGGPEIGIGLHYEESYRLDLYQQPWVVDYEVRWPPP